MTCDACWWSIRPLSLKTLSHGCWRSVLLDAPTHPIHIILVLIFNTFKLLNDMNWILKAEFVWKTKTVSETWRKLKAIYSSTTNSSSLFCIPSGTSFGTLQELVLVHGIFWIDLGVWAGFEAFRVSTASRHGGGHHWKTWGRGCRSPQHGKWLAELKNGHGMHMMHQCHNFGPNIWSWFVFFHLYHHHLVDFYLLLPSVLLPMLSTTNPCTPDFNSWLQLTPSPLSQHSPSWPTTGPACTQQLSPETCTVHSLFPGACCSLILGHPEWWVGHFHMPAQALRVEGACTAALTRGCLDAKADIRQP